MTRASAKPYRPGGAYYTPPPVARAIVGRWAEEFRAYRPRGRMLRTLDQSVGGGAFPMALLFHDLVRPGSLEVMDLDPSARGLRLPIGQVCTVAADTGDPVQTGSLTTDPQQRPDLVLGNPAFGVPRPPEACPRCKGKKYMIRTTSDGAFENRWMPCSKCHGVGLRTFKRPIPVAQLHIRRALEVTDRYVLLLLRLAMLEGESRSQLWEDTPLRHVDVLARRPKFSEVCHTCAGTNQGVAVDCSTPPPCPDCDGGRVQGSNGTDLCAYGAFLWDLHHTGPPTLGHLQTPDSKRSKTCDR